VFVTSADAEKETLLAMCFDRRTGKLVWKHESAGPIRRDYRSNFAAPSAVTDGKIVVFFFSNGQLTGYDFEGKEIWSRNIKKDYGVFAFQWTFSSSPTIVDGKLYLQVLQRDVAVRDRGFRDRNNESYILAMNPKTGKTIWRHFRPSKAVAESLEAFSTPVPAVLGGVKQLLVVGGDALSGHDLATGKELWRWGTWNPDRIGHWRLVPSPVEGKGVVLACGPKNSPIFAVAPNMAGVLDDSAIVWDTKEKKEIGSDVPTPAFYDGDFFILNDLRKNLSRVEPRTGKVKWTIPTPDRAKYEPSPLAADGKIYIINHEGEAAVINAADGKVISEITMDDPAGREVVRASISAANGQLFIRTTRKLYCIGKQ
jgi:outer membrane protein assembly factor BamB